MPSLDRIGKGLCQNTGTDPDALNVTGMVGNQRLTRSMADPGALCAGDSVGEASIGATRPAPL